MSVAITKRDRTKLIVGVVLLLIAIPMLYNALFSSRSPAPPGAASAPPAAQPGASSSFAQLPSLTAAQRQRATGGRHGATATAGDVTDPKLRLDLLAKVASVKYDAGGRSVFAFHTPPPPPPPPMPKPSGSAIVGPDGKPQPSTPPGPPPPPPIPLKFYGYAHKPGETQKKVFLIEGDEIYIASQGDVVKKRYKIDKIGVNTVEVEDIVSHNKQSLPLQETP